MLSKLEIYSITAVFIAKSLWMLTPGNFESIYFFVNLILAVGCVSSIWGKEFLKIPIADNNKDVKHYIIRSFLCVLLACGDVIIAVPLLMMVKSGYTIIGDYPKALFINDYSSDIADVICVTSSFLFIFGIYRAWIYLSGGLRPTFPSIRIGQDD